MVSITGVDNTLVMFVALMFVALMFVALCVIYMRVMLFHGPHTPCHVSYITCPFRCTISDNNYIIYCVLFGQSADLTSQENRNVTGQQYIIISTNHQTTLQSAFDPGCRVTLVSRDKSRCCVGEFGRDAQEDHAHGLSSSPIVNNG